MKTDTGILQTLLVSVVCVFFPVCLIFINKSIYGDFEFEFAATLSTVNGVAGSVAVIILRLLGLIEGTGGFSSAVGTSLFYALSSILLHTSLLHNSVGTFQVLRLLHVVVFSVINWIMHDTDYSESFKSGLVLLTIASGVTLANDAEVTHDGIFYGLLATGVTGIYFVMVREGSSRNAKEGITHLASAVPLGTLISLFFIPIVDDVEDLQKFLLSNKVDKPLLGMGVLSCLCFMVCIAGECCADSLTTPTLKGRLHYARTILLVATWLVLTWGELSPAYLAGLALALGGMVRQGQGRVLSEEEKMECMSARSSSVASSVSESSSRSDKGAPAYAPCSEERRARSGFFAHSAELAEFSLERSKSVGFMTKEQDFVARRKASKPAVISKDVRRLTEKFEAAFGKEKLRRASSFYEVSG